MLGIVAGVVSVIGYAKSSPILESLGIFDTCGVGNLHGYPSILGGLASAFFVAVDADNVNLPDITGHIPLMISSASASSSALRLIDMFFGVSIMKASKA